MNHKEILASLSNDEAQDYLQYGKIPDGYREVNGTLLVWDWKKDPLVSWTVKDIYSLYGMIDADPDGEMKHQIALSIKKALDAKETK